MKICFWNSVTNAQDERDATPEEIAEVEARVAASAYSVAADKLTLNAEINTWRAAINYTTFPHAGKFIACDVLSRSDIDAVANHIALFGTFPASFPGAWKTTDNTLIMQPTIADFKAMFTSMTTQGTANFNQSQTWKASTNSATTRAELDAIRAEMGL